MSSIIDNKTELAIKRIAEALKPRFPDVAVKSKEIDFDGDKRTLYHLEAAGHDLSRHLSFAQTYKHHSAWRSSATEKLRISVIDLEHRSKSWPERKDGTHDYASIADALGFEIARLISRREAEKKRSELAPAIDRLREKLTLVPSYQMKNFSPSIEDDKPIRFSIHIGVRSLTEKQAEIIARALIEIGINP